MRRPFRLAVGQSPAELATTQARLDWLEIILPEVPAQQTDIILLPELFATGYNIGDEINARAEATDDPTAQAISALAQKHNVAVHYGFVEQGGSQN